MKSELIIGREAPADIVVPPRAYRDTVSARHMKVIPAPQPGQYTIVDLGSSNGLSVKTQQGWTAVSHATVAVDTPLRLGLYVTSLRELCPPAFFQENHAQQQVSPRPAAAPRHPYRDPKTGEIIG